MSTTSASTRSAILLESDTLNSGPSPICVNVNGANDATAGGSGADGIELLQDSPTGSAFGVQGYTGGATNLSGAGEVESYLGGYGNSFTGGSGGSAAFADPLSGAHGGGNPTGFTGGTCNTPL